METFGEGLWIYGYHVKGVRDIYTATLMSGYLVPLMLAVKTHESEGFFREQEVQWED